MKMRPVVCDSIAHNMLWTRAHFLSSFNAFLRERIFGPLGMRDTHFYLPEAKLDRFASLYRPDGKQKLEVAERQRRIVALCASRIPTLVGPEDLCPPPATTSGSAR